LPIPCTGESCDTFSLNYQDGNIIIRTESNISTYFRFSKGNKTGDGLSLATSPSLRGPWRLNTYAGGILANSLIDPTGADRENTHLWAPEAHLIAGKYCLYYCIFDSTIGNGTNGAAFDIAVATSPSMEDGTWTDHGSIGIPLDKKEYVALGVNVLVNSSTNTAHVAWGSFNNGLFGMELDRKAAFLNVSLLPSPKLLVQDQPLPYTGIGYKGGSNVTEGAFQWQDDIWLYIFYSQGHCCNPSTAQIGTEYRVKVCRTSAATPQGPYLDKTNAPCVGPLNDAGTIILATHSNNAVYSPGSVGVMIDPVEGLVMYYQYYDWSSGDSHPPIRFGFNYLEFQGGWPVLVGARNFSTTGNSNPKKSAASHLSFLRSSIHVIGICAYGIFITILMV
jgi:arabinan endo-1,5-alpha-L-arabinosidase